MEKNVYFCSMKFPRCHRLSILRKPFGRALLWMLVLVAAMPAAAQNCQGFMNPTSFNYAPGSTGRWSARVGDRIVGATGGSTGNNILSTCSYPTAQNIIGHQNITSPQLYSGACTYTDNTCHHTFYDAHDHRFSIYTLSANSGLDEFTVNGNNGLPRIPPGFTSSIRLGDMRSTGTAVYPNSGTYPVGNNRGSEALFYTMQVRPQTAFIFINYAVVARRFDHSPQQAGEFLIRVVGKDPATHQWNLRHPGPDGHSARRRRHHLQLLLQALDQGGHQPLAIPLRLCTHRDVHLRLHLQRRPHLRLHRRLMPVHDHQAAGMRLGRERRGRHP